MNLTDPTLYTNRELSWLEFNERVLEEAQDKTNPIMERLKFLAISASNLDEFFMVRVSSLMRSEITDPSGMTPKEQLAAISKRVHEMVQRQYSCFTKSLIPAMEKENIRFLTYSQLTDSQKNQVKTYFNKVLYQVLTPMAIDQSRPFPTLNNRTVNIFVELAPDEEATPVRTVEWDSKEARWHISEKSNKGARYAVVQVPTVVPRIVPVKTEDKTAHHFILLENILLEHIGRLFMGYTVTRTSLLRVTRNSDLDIDEEDIDDLLDEVTRSIKGRRWGDPVRIEITKGMSKPGMALIKKALGVTEDKLYEIKGPPDFNTWMNFSMKEEFEHLRYKLDVPSPVAEFVGGESMFDVIRNRDVLVHHPYMSFDCVTRFVKEAAADPNVLAIKQTLYRVSGQSPIVRALIQAAENGKQVTVLVELKARFDEENNINWAKLMEKAGVHVVYGLAGLKTHCKVCLVVRREKKDIRRYLHLGTGNYNEATAKIYTDVGLFTCNEAFGQDASVLFNVLTGYAKATDWQKFAVAPLTLRSTFEKLIEQETKNAQEGKPAAITAKMNSLTDVAIIESLYKASQAGVKIRLLVRGTCRLKPGIPGVSENIEVSSIVDRYLEHSRIFIFENDGAPKVFLASADWMTRNLSRRVEVMFPIENTELQEKLITIMDISLSDNVKRRIANPDGTYERPPRRGKAAVQAQLALHKRAAAERDGLVKHQM